MYIVNSGILKGIEEQDLRARMGIVKYLDDWSEDVFQKARSTGSISGAGEYIRERVLDNDEMLRQLMEEVVLMDLSEFWRTIYGRLGTRDDVLLYTIFCTLFSELNEEIASEYNKIGSSVGFIPSLREDFIKDIEEAESKDKKGGIFGVFNRGKKKEKVKKQAPKGKVNEYEEGIVEIKDKYVRPDNVGRLTVIFSVTAVILFVAILGVLLF